MSLFKKKAKFTTIQEAQAEFNQTLFQLGDLNLRKHMVKQNLTQLENEIVETTKKLDAIGKSAQELNQKAQAELAKTVKQGEPSVKAVPPQA